MANSPKRINHAGEVVKAQFSPMPPPFKKEPRRTAAQKAGIKYEKKALEWLSEQHPNLMLSPWLMFVENGVGVRWCQPDALLFDFQEGVITIVEIKLKHTVRAYHQLLKLYLPVLKKMFPPELWSFRSVEMVMWFDPHEFFPCRYKMLDTIETENPTQVGVFVWNPRIQKRVVSKKLLSQKL